MTQPDRGGVAGVAARLLDALPQTRALHPWLLTDHWLSYADLARMMIR